MKTIYKTVTTCRVCGADLQTVLELGQMPLVNRLVDPKDNRDEPVVPLTLAECPGCDLLQLEETVFPEVLFGENYPYYSSSSATMVLSMQELATEMVGRYTGVQRNTTPAPMKFGRALKVFEIASNDGYLLKHYKALGHEVLGCEPADGPRRMAESIGIQTLPKFFTGRGEPEVTQAAGGYFDLIHAHNVVAHVADLVPFLKGVRELLMPEGIFVLEVPNVVDTLKAEAFDQVYHEHIFYFSIETLCFALAKAGLVILEAKKSPLHGGSLRVLAARDTSKRARHPMAELLTDRVERRVLTRALARSVERQSDWLRGAVLTAQEGGRRVAAYGASAKGCVRLMQARLGPTQIDFVADKTEAKWGKHMPGVRVPILAASELEARRPDLTVLLTWNFSEEIRKEQKGYLQKGGRFLDPLTGRLW